MTLKTERRIALFLDFENLVSNTGFSASSFDLQPSLDRLLEKGKIVFRRAYCDWTRFKDAKAGLHALGVELIDVPPSTAAGKNAADMRLVIDALELCYAREHIDTFVIASGDSDFCPLAYKLRENGRVVIGLAAKESTSPLFVKACDEFIYLKPSHRRGGEEERGKKGGAAAKPGRGEKEKERKEAERPRRASVPAAVREVVQSLLARSDGPLNPSVIKETLVRKEPDFDVRDLGFSTFSRLLEALEKEGLLKLQLKGRQWYVLPPELSREHAGSGRDAAESEGAERDIAEPEGAEPEEDEEVYPDPDDEL